MKIFAQRVYILCRDREKIVQLPLNILFMCLAASGNILYFLRNVRLLLKENVRLLLKGNVQLIFCVCVCVAASENISCFLRNVRLFLKDINVQLLLKDNVQLRFRIMST